MAVGVGTPDSPIKKTVAPGKSFFVNSVFLKFLMTLLNDKSCACSTVLNAIKVSLL